MSLETMWMICFCVKEGDTEEEANSGLYKDLMEAKDKFTSIGQVLDDNK